jgi:hypothetical protein
VRDNANRQAVIETARQQNGQLPDACDSATYTETSQAVVLSPPQVTAPNSSARSNVIFADIRPS